MNPSDPSLDPRRRAQEKSAKKTPMMRQLDRVAAEMNPLLIIFMLGLGILDLTCYVGLEMSNSQHMQGLVQATYRR